MVSCKRNKIIGDWRLISSKLGFASAQVPFLIRGLRLAWEPAPAWAWAWVALLVVQGALPAAAVQMTRSLVNNLVAAAAAGGEFHVLLPAFLTGAILAGILLLLELLGSISGLIRSRLSEVVQDHITALIQRKSIEADLAFYESADFYDHLHRARSEAAHRPVALLESVGSLFQNTITMVAMAAVMLPLGLWLPGALLISTAPAFYVVLHYAARQHQWRVKITSDERRTWYYDWLLTSGETAAEMRLYGLGSHFRVLFQGLRARLRGESIALARSRCLAEAGAAVIALLITGVAMALMLLKAVRGLVTLGDVALFYQAFTQGQRLMRSLLENAGQIYYNMLFLRNLFEFLELESRVVDDPRPLQTPLTLTKGISFQDVSFSYPPGSREALRGFSICIPANSIVAIVGPNGAGKSTIIKLLCRLYDPDEGTIQIDGVDLRRLSTAQLRRSISVLFQQPVQYNATIAENIALGDLVNQPDHLDIENAACAAGADVIAAKLPAGYDTLLGKWFAGGIGLSVGEWQRIALARSFLRKAPIILLDEPTSAMDSWAEADWMDRLRWLTSGRTTVIITHRFTTAMRADTIHVLEEGGIVESGSHEELLARGGRYAASWLSQMKARSDQPIPQKLAYARSPGKQGI